MLAMGVTMRIHAVVTALSISAGLIVPRVDAQVVRGDLSVGGGTGTDQRGVRSSAVTIAPSVLFVPNALVSVGVSGSATHFGSSARAIGGTASFGARLPLGSVLSVAGSGAGTMTKTSFNATYSSADATPTLEAGAGRVTVFGGLHVATGSAVVREMNTSPGGVFSNPVVGGRDVTTSRSSTGAVFGGVLDVDRASGTKLAYREEHARVTGIAVTDRVATGIVGNERFALGAVAGVRDAPDEQRTFGSITGTLALAPTVALQAAVGSYPSNRVTGTVGGSFASIGFSLRGLRRLDRENDAPVVRGVPAPAKGVTRLVIEAEGAQRVEIAGDWNDWTPAPATAASNSAWYRDVRLQPGEHRYAFRIDGKRWVVPEGVASVDDGFGGRSALVTVH